MQKRGFRLMAKSYGTHEVADIFPSMTDIEYEALKASIAENGQREAIVAVDDLIVDGRHRYKACQELGIAPRVRQIKDQGDGWLIGYVLDANLHRRHLSESQRAMLAARLPKMKQGERTDKPSTNLHEVRYLDGSSDTIRMSAGERAERLNVSRTSVFNAQKVVASGDEDLISKVDDGVMTVSYAADMLSGREKAAEIIEDLKQNPPKEMKPKKKPLLEDDVMKQFYRETESIGAPNPDAIKLESMDDLVAAIADYDVGTIIAGDKTFTAEEGGDTVFDLDDLVSDS